MRVSVFGLGYVGCVSAACLAQQGHDVIGVDVSPTKVELVNKGVAPVVEERIGEITADVVAAGKLRAIGDPAAAVAQTEISLVCPPSTWSGSPRRSARRWPPSANGTPWSSVAPCCPAPASGCWCRSWRRCRGRRPASTSAWR
jgi:hypothetical protein